jgi:tRNA-dihydrouridine synthase B
MFLLAVDENLNIGPYPLANQLVLAPMAGVTDLPFRILCREQGAGLAVSEMVASNSLLWGSKKTLRRSDHSGEPEPRSVQIVGADPAMMAEAARFNADRGAQIIDINMGCPAKKICNVSAGSALLQKEQQVVAILKAVVKAVSIPVTLKIRTGWDKDHRNGVRIALLAEAEGIQALSVHGRTRACAFKGEAEYDTIAAIKAVVSIPVIANGDITDPIKARQVLNYTRADGIMIGRAAQGKPWLFHNIDHYLKHGEILPDPPLAVIRDIMLRHLDRLYSFYGRYTGVRVARKHISWYSKGQRNSAEFRQHINQVETTQEQYAQTKRFFDQQIELGDLAA